MNSTPELRPHISCLAPRIKIRGVPARGRFSWSGPLRVMDIDRCYCFKRTFAELKDVAQSCEAGSIEELQEYVTFGQNCELCHPYVRRMLRTGEVTFGKIITADDEPG